MTITVDLVTEDLRTGTSSPTSWTHNGAASGVKGALLMIVHGTSSTDHVSTAKYGGVTMTRVARFTDTVTEPGAAEIWFLGSGLPQGSRLFSYTAGATTDDILAVGVTLLASTDLVVIDSDGQTENRANPSVTLNYNSRSAMAFAALYSGLTDPTAITVGANCTALSTTDIAGAFTGFFQRQTTAGTADFTIGVTAATDDAGYAAVAVAEVYSDLVAASRSFTLSGQAVTLTPNQRGSSKGAAPFPWMSSLYEETKGIVAAQGSFAKTGQSAGLLIGHKLTAAQGSFTLSGQAATLTKASAGAFSMPAGYGTVTLTGQAVTLTYSTRGKAGHAAPFPFLSTLYAGAGIVAARGTFTLTGQAAGLLHKYTLTAAQGSIAWTRNDATLSKSNARAISAATGTFTRTGQAVGLLWGHKLTAAYGAVALTGQAATLNGAGLGRSGSRAWLPSLSSLLDTTSGTYLIQAAKGAFTLTGQAINAVGPRLLGANTGLFNVVPGATSLLGPKYLTAAYGTFALEGAETLIDAQVTAARGAFVLSGQAVTLTRVGAARTLAAGNGSFIRTGQSVNLLWGHKLALAQGSFTETGQAVAFFRGHPPITAAVGSFTETGEAVLFARTYQMVASAGSFAETGFQAVFNATTTPNSTQMAANGGVYALTGRVAAFRKGWSLTTATGVYTLDGEDSNLLYGRRFPASAGTFALNGQQVGLYAPTNRWINADTGLFALTGFDTGPYSVAFTASKLIITDTSYEVRITDDSYRVLVYE